MGSAKEKKNKHPSVREGSITHKVTVRVFVDLQWPSRAGVWPCHTEATHRKERGVLANLTRTGRNPVSAEE